MANTAMWFRSLGVALVLLVAMLYLSSLNLKTLGPRNVVDAGSNYRPTKDSIPSYSEHVAAEFRHGRQSVNSSIAAQDQGFYGGPEQTNEVFVPHDSRLVKRELGQEWNCLVETGWKGLVEGIFLAIEGHPFPTPNWGKVNEKLLKAHGWERNRDDTATLPEVWKDAFQMMPKALPHYIENTRMTWVHVLPYSYEDRRQRVCQSTSV